MANYLHLQEAAILNDDFYSLAEKVEMLREINALKLEVAKQNCSCFGNRLFNQKPGRIIVLSFTDKLKIFKYLEENEELEFSRMPSKLICEVDDFLQNPTLLNLNKFAPNYKKMLEFAMAENVILIFVCKAFN